MKTTTDALNQPLALTANCTAKNRLFKSAMSEQLGNKDLEPTPELIRLYRTWAQGGTGLLVTGNIMIDRNALGEPKNVVLDEQSNLEHFKALAAAGCEQDTQLWMQINHPGRQVYAAMGGQVLSPSDIALDMGKHSKLFAKPMPMTETEILALIKRFVTTASRAVEAGFNGVQIHAAHGYLLSQFLSPLTNKRNDQWGGSLDNRARLLYEIIKAVKKALPENIVIAVKLNSADFQRGGFDSNEASAVVKALGELKVDLVELSGGSYESPAMQGNTADGRTLEREAYFLTFAKEIAKQAPMPIMTTGGIVRLSIAQKVLDEGVDMVGIGRALAFSPNLPYRWKTSPDAIATLPNVKWKDKTMAAIATMAITKRQLQRMGKGKAPKSNSSPVISLIFDQIRLKKLTKIYRDRYTNSSNQ